jgi:hypothetical protein
MRRIVPFAVVVVLHRQTGAARRDHARRHGEAALAGTARLTVSDARHDWTVRRTAREAASALVLRAAPGEYTLTVRALRFRPLVEYARSSGTSTCRSPRCAAASSIMRPASPSHRRT